MRQGFDGHSVKGQTYSRSGNFDMICITERIFPETKYKVPVWEFYINFDFSCYFSVFRKLTNEKDTLWKRLKFLLLKMI
jgi:hypothetical protein